MMPAYRSMDSYPYQRNQMPFPHCWYPGIEANPPHITDPPKSPFSCEQPWPYAGSYGHPIPTHFCCGHNHFPGYSFTPHPSASAPSPIYRSGCYAAYGEPSFVTYHPQPHYAMELPRYEYDKHMPREYHCCGCPNHPSHQNESNGVKIEDQEPEAGKKVSDALVPTQLKNYPYPFVWIPPEYTSTRELKNPVADEVGEQEKISHDRNPPGPWNFRADAQEPKVWNGWLPFDINGTPHVVHEGDGRRNQNWENENNRWESKDGRMDQKHQSEHKKSEFPFPIIWMPYYNKEEQGGRTNNQERTSTPKCIEEVPHTFKSIPVNSKADEGVTNGIRPNQVESTDTSGSEVTKEVTNERSIPVKHQGKNDSNGGDKRKRNIPVHQMEENVTKKDSLNSAERQSTSPRKTSKLPPVCLRVDPLPRKKNGNGSSRSPSPPSKEHSQVTAGEKCKTLSGGTNDKAQPNSDCQNAANISEKVKPKERTIQVSESKSNGNSRSSSTPASKKPSQTTAGETSKTLSVGMNGKAQPNLNVQNAPNISEEVKPKEGIIPVTKIKPVENKVSDCIDRSQSRMNSNMPSGHSVGTKESHTDGDREENKAKKGAQNTMEEAIELREVTDSSKLGDEDRKEKKVLSDTDAAVLIQAAYRGYQVRKWEPLKKLKQIAEVSKELTNIRERVQAFEHSPDLQNDDKQRITIGETIMRLLLKLDTIQGLHSSFREIRKSLARELVSLQERLDSLVAKIPQQQLQEKSVDDSTVNMQKGECVQGVQEENSAVPGKDSVEGTSYGSHDQLEEFHGKFSMKDDINCPPADYGGRESHSPVDPASNEEIEPIVPLNSLVNEDVNQVAAVDVCKSTSDRSEADKMDREPDAKLDVDNIPIEVDNLDVTDLKELPVGVIDEDVDLHSKKDEQNEKGRKEDQLTGCTNRSLPAPVDHSASDEVDSVIHPMTELPVGLPDEDMVTAKAEKDDGTTIYKGELPAEDGEYIAELPVGLLDEDVAKSEFEKHVETKAPEDVLPAEEGKCNADKNMNSSTDHAAKVMQLEQQLLEEQEEVQSFGESDGWVKVEFQIQDECKGNAPKDIEVECGEDIENDAKVPSLTTQVNGQEQANGECLVENYVHNIQPEPVGSLINTEEHAPISDLQKEEEPEEKVAQRETQDQGHDILAEQAMSVDAEDKKTQTLAKEKTELSAPVAEYDGGFNGDVKLLEENEKLRKMMKKLLEAGNQQMNVISDLTGRVKDLERKLARSKRVKTKRYRPATSNIRSKD